jgi:hypothetical protein
MHTYGGYKPLIWDTLDFGDLSLKEAYSFINHHSIQLHWKKFIWCT